MPDGKRVDPSESAQGYRALGDAFTSISESLDKLATGLRLFSKVPDETIEKFARFSNLIAKGASDKDGRSYESYGKMLEFLGASLGKMAWGLFLWTFVPKSSVEKAAESITSLSKAFGKLDSTKAKEGGEAVKSMAGAVFLFGLSMVASAALYVVAAIAAPAIAVTLYAFGKLFEWIGKDDKIDRGAEAVGKMALGVAGFATSLWLTIKLLGGSAEGFSQSVGMVALSVLLFSGVFWLVGDEKFSQRVKNGAESLVFSGLGIASVALGIVLFKALGIDAATAGVTALSVLLVGTAFGLVGLFGDTIKKGAMGLAFSGLGLASLALGIWSFDALKITAQGILIAGLAVAVVGAAFGLAGVFASQIALGVLTIGFSALALWGVAAAVKQFDGVTKDQVLAATGTVVAITGAMITAGLASIFILPGVIAIGAAGLALGSIASGLKKFKDVDFTESDAGKAELVIKSLAGAFSAAGGSEGADKLFGITIGPNAVKRGIASVMDAGEALTSITKGLQSFQKLNLGVGAPIWDDVALVVSGVGEVFSKVGSGSRTRKGLLGFIGLETNDVEQGIKNVMGTGDALNSIAKGLDAFRKMKLGPGEAQKLWDNISFVVGGVSAAFSTIGGQNTPMSGFFPKLFGMERNKTEDGIDAVKGVGQELVDLAAGVQAFTKLEFTDPITKKTIKLDDGMLALVGQNISKILTVVSDEFGKIGAKSSGGIFGFFKSNEVEDGISAVKGVGAELKNIADSVSVFAGLKDVATIETNIRKMIAVIPSAFVDVYKNVVGKDGVAVLYVKELIAKAVDPVKRLGDMLAEFKGDGKSGKNLGESISSLFSGLRDIPSGTNLSMLGDVTSYIERLAKASSPMQVLANSFGKMAGSMDKFAASFKKMNVEAVKTSGMLIDALVVFSKVSPATLDTLNGRGKALMQFILDRGASAPQAQAPVSKVEPPPQVSEPPLYKPQPVVQPKQAAGFDPQLAASMATSLQQNAEVMNKMLGTLGRIEALLSGKIKAEIVN
jgi:methyl-accepting chemotaxis protein